MGLKGFLAGGRLRELQLSPRLPSPCAIFLPYTKTLPSLWLFSPALRALLSEALQLYFWYSPGIANLSLDWAQIRKGLLSFYVAWDSDLVNPAILGGSNIPKSLLRLLPQPKMSNSHSPYLKRRASWVRWGEGWWRFLRLCAYLRRTVSPAVQFGLG